MKLLRRAPRCSSARWLFGAVFAFVVAPSSARAEGFALNRFEPAGPSAAFFSADSLGYSGSNRYFVGGVFDWGHNPLVAYDEAGEATSTIIADQIFAHLGATFIGFSRVRLNINLPVLLYQNGTPTTVNGTTFTPSDGAGVGDLRLSGDVRLFGEARKGFELAAGLRFHLPTGSQENLTSDGQIRLAPRVQAAGKIGPFEYSARVGVQIRPRDQDVSGVAFGSEFEMGAAAGYRFLDEKLLIGPEFWGTTAFSDGEVFGKGSTEVELIGGVHYQPNVEWNFGLGFGPGMTRGLGAPQTRTLLSVEWTPAPTPVLPADRDGDGVSDAVDGCPDAFGPSSSMAEKNGCPEPKDRDGDGIADGQDACVDEPGPASDVATKNGCPPPADRDGDGVPDASDRCPGEAGLAKVEDPSLLGCPPAQDRDGDKIPDGNDACPDQPGVASDVRERNGCPLPEKKGDQLVIPERIEFENDSAELRTESEKALGIVLSFLQGEPNAKLRIEGHTDNRGGVKRNTVLSTARAKAVVDWLVARGISAGRLSSEGYGPARPVAPNNDDAGRRANRRVEFHVLSEKDSKEATP